MTIVATAPPARRRIVPVLTAFVAVPILGVLGFFWLAIPDSHAWQLVLSLLTGAVIFSAFLWIVSAAVRGIRNPAVPCAHWLGALLLAVWMIIKWALVGLALRIDDHSPERAGFWNSKLSAHMRNTFTYDRMIAWQHDVVLLLIWVLIPVLLTPFFIETVARGLGLNVWRTSVAVLKRWQHWLVIIACDAAVYWITGRLIGWKPSHSVHGELFSLGFRLALCYAIDFTLIMLLLAVDGKLLAREHARRYAGVEPPADVS